MTWPFNIVVFLSLAMSTSVRAEQNDWQLTLLTEHNPPHSYIDTETGAFKGGSVAIVTALMNEASIKYEIIQLPWNRAYRRTLSEKNVCLFPANKTPDRWPLFQWVAPLQSGGWAIFQRHDSNINIENLSDLKKYGIVGKMASIATDELEKTLGVKVAKAADDMGAVRLLYGGRVDLWLSGATNGPDSARMAGYPPAKVAFNWKPAEVGLICSLSTDQAIMRKLNDINALRLARLAK